MKFPGIRQILHLVEIESTQTLARALADGGAEHRTLVWADRQTKGRGRLSRTWSSPRGGLYFSLILRPGTRFSPDRLAGLSLMTAQAAADAIADCTGIQSVVKPPNDVLGWRGHGLPKKICGILIEASGGSRRLDWIVVGIGVNVNNRPRGLPGASSLKTLTGKTWKVEGILEELLRKFNCIIDQ